jgi:IclR family acetate operon transcriptional repressor
VDMILQMMNTVVDKGEAPQINRRAGTRIQSVARAARVLLWTADQPHGASAKEVAAAHGLALPTTYHLLNTLVDEGLLAKDSQGRYILGRSAAILAEAHLRGRSVPETMLAALRELTRRTEETTYLADWGEADIRVLASVEGRQMVRVAEVGSGVYSNGHARANGKVLLAYAAPQVRDAYLRAHPIVPVTGATITTREALDRELKLVRERGYAYDEEEFAPGVSCVAAPVLQNGHVVASLGIVAPTDRFLRGREDLTRDLLGIVHSLEDSRPAEVAAAS